MGVATELLVQVAQLFVFFFQARFFAGFFQELPFDIFFEFANFFTQRRQCLMQVPRILPRKPLRFFLQEPVGQVLEFIYEAQV